MSAGLPKDSLIAIHKERILEALPKDTKLSLAQQSELLLATHQAVTQYRALLPFSKPKRRPHRTRDAKAARLAHRPTNTPRQALVGGLYDAFMGARDDDISSRGFNRFCKVIFAVERLPFSKVTAHDLAILRAQRQPFIDYIAKTTPADSDS